MVARLFFVTEQRLVFGDVAQQYDDARPGYPDELFNAVMSFGNLGPGDRALEIGAGTGKATTGFLTRGLDVHALEPSAGMAAVLRGKGVDAQETSFEDWALQREAFRLVYAAQSWHWVRGDDRYDKVAAALAHDGIVALFWNQARKLDVALQRENDAVYEQHAPEMGTSTGKRGLVNWVPARARRMRRVRTAEPTIVHVAPDIHDRGVDSTAGDGVRSPNPARGATRSPARGRRRRHRPTRRAHRRCLRRLPLYGTPARLTHADAAQRFR
jgi:SAM-dependent methyltransferase